MPAYAPAPFRRYFGVSNDPTAGGTNLDSIQGNATLGVTADTVNFPSAVIPDQTTTWPIKTATGAWGKSNINFDDLITGTRAGPAELPYKSMPTFSVTFDAHRYVVEKIMKCAMGVEGTLTPAVYEVDTLSGTAGAPGPYAFSWNGTTYTTASVAISPSNAVLQAALLAAKGPQGQTLPAATITVAAGPLPAATTVTFSGAMAGAVTSFTVPSGMAAVVRTTPGTPPVHPISGKGFGTSQLPALLLQLIEDAVNRKFSGCIVESFELVVPAAGAEPATITAELHPLYGQIVDDHVSPLVPTGVNPEPYTLPMLARDMTVAFDGGTASIGISEFRFGWKNNNMYDNFVLGSCVGAQTLNGKTSKLWFPAYNRITGRQSVTYGYTLLDSAVGDELAMQWSQIRSLVATMVDPSGGSDQIVVNLYQAMVNQDGGIPAAAATGRLSSTYVGKATYDPVAATDALVTVTNRSSTVI